MSQNKPAVYLQLGVSLAVLLGFCVFSMLPTGQEIDAPTKKQMVENRKLADSHRLLQHEYSALVNVHRSRLSQAKKYLKELEEKPSLESNPLQSLEKYRTPAQTKQAKDPAKTSDKTAKTTLTRYEKEIARGKVLQAKNLDVKAKLKDLKVRTKGLVKYLEVLRNRISDKREQDAKLKMMASIEGPKRQKSESQVNLSELEGSASQLEESPPTFSFGFESIPKAVNDTTWSEASRDFFKALESAKKRTQDLKKKQMFNYFYQNQEREAYLELEKNFSALTVLLGEKNTLEALSNPLIVANLVQRALLSKKQPLSKQQIININTHGSDAMAELRTAQNATKDAIEFERISVIAAVKHRFQSKLRSELTETQKKLLFETSELRPRLNVFSPLLPLIFNRKLTWDYKRDMLVKKVSRILYVLAGKSAPKQIPESLTKAIQEWIDEHPTAKTPRESLSQLDRRYFTFEVCLSLVTAQLKAMKALAKLEINNETAQRRIKRTTRLNIVSHVKLK